MNAGLQNDNVISGPQNDIDDIVQQIRYLLDLDEEYNADQTNFEYFNSALELIDEYDLDPVDFGFPELPPDNLLFEDEGFDED